MTELPLLLRQVDPIRFKDLLPLGEAHDEIQSISVRDELLPVQQTRS